MTTDLGAQSAAGHGEIYDGSGRDLSNMRRSDFLSDLLNGYLPRVPTRDALPTADETQYQRIVIVGSGVAPDVFYVCLITAIGPPIVYSWVDLSTAPVIPPAITGLALVGSDNTERTASTSNTLATMSTISGLSIATGVFVEVHFEYRKTSGAAERGIFGLTLNATAVSNTGIVVTGNTNNAESGIAVIRIGPREANYLRAVNLQYAAYGAGSTDDTLAVANADMPAATLTSIVILGGTTANTITYAIKNVRVYTYP